ncbi:MAG: S-layer homology domain-containing protein [Armatimonadota bacterium]|nr:MAG: S-layer homology domain-containing protein [Armatimonadota bacterium]
MRTLTFLLLGATIAIAGLTAYEALAEPLGTHYPGSYYFSDCSPESPHDSDIGYLYESGIANGFTPDIYGPELPTSRQEMASFVARTEAVIYWLTFMSVDWNFFDGYYTGEWAYNDGRITLEEYQTATRVMEWSTAAVKAEFDSMRDTDIETVFDIYF